VRNARHKKSHLPFVGRKSEAPSAGWIAIHNMRRFKFNFAGGSSAATYFLLRGQEKVSKEKERPDAVSRSAGAGGAPQL